MYLQKLTTAEPDRGQLEVAIAALKAAMAEDQPLGEGFCDINGRFLTEDMPEMPEETKEENGEETI